MLVELEPGPIDDSVLTRQASHRSARVWDLNVCLGLEESVVLTCRRRELALSRVAVDPRLLPLIEAVGFTGLMKVPFIQLDWHLITALVERWRPKTHSFHMPTGETTITLQDVSIQLGLRVDGRPITGRMDYNWPEECDRLLGMKPTEDLDQAGQYSWGSGALGWLYRDLCRATVPTAHEIGGCLILLKVWAWDSWHDVFSVVQVPTHAVRQYRFSFDTMTSDQVVWEPYSANVVAALPDYCRVGSEVWQAVTPLLCFPVAKWHQPDRVLRQFGQRQQVPDASHSLSEQHGRDLRAIVNDWSVEHAPLISLWEERLEHVVTGPPLDGDLSYHDPYLVWYRRITRRYVSRLACTYD
ncbi:hypothetical protein Vadar_034102 [Vaccinium darrowii]|uniref:Uncharacterized protein n=1 Tax=Vaccinium darrowii TaxID=229202 RepID=A0ACB7XWU4_9ERIC|nr:hypothetical protein Vadar_034102 [Vaccinium darrowii]